ncbi:MAG: glycosyltransferase family 4 protein [Anaerolineae bacterium]|nr:glycosyltransferase family 4 protein [Anaerolineae bacterium]
MRVLMITQMIDRSDDLLGFTHEWVATLAARVDRLDVLALEVGDYDLPANVTIASMGKERGAGRPGRLSGFYRGLQRYIGAVDVVFVHMIPLYTLLAWPLAALHRKPITLWYTHRASTFRLWLATQLVRHVATAHPTSFPLASSKVHALGHGIDITAYTPAPAPPPEPPRVLSLGRLSAIKKHETLIRAAALLRDKHGDPSARFVIAGGLPNDAPPDYELFLDAEIARLRVGDRVTLWGAVPADAVPSLFHEASVAINLSPPGLFDKAALESMLCGVPTIVANAAFDDVLGPYRDGLRVSSGDDAEGLAARLKALLLLSAAERQEIGLALRERVAAAHSLSGLMDRLVALMAS